jgi:subtilase family serine protease
MKFVGILICSAGGDTMKHLTLIAVLGMCLFITGCDEMTNLLIKPVADLTIINVSYQTEPPGCVTQQTKTVLSVYIANTGQADAGTFAVEAGAEKQVIHGLAANEYLDVVFLDDTEGSLHNVIIDRDNAVVESDETNNSKLDLMVPMLTYPAPCTATPSGS